MLYEKNCVCTYIRVRVHHFSRTDPYLSITCSRNRIKCFLLGKGGWLSR